MQKSIKKASLLRYCVYKMANYKRLCKDNGRWLHIQNQHCHPRILYKAYQITMQHASLSAKRCKYYAGGGQIQSLCAIQNDKILKNNKRSEDD